MALGFQSGAFQSPGFQQHSGGFRPVGGFGGDDFFLRIIKLDDEEVRVVNTEDIEREVAEKIGAIPIEASADPLEPEWPTVRMPPIDWVAVERLTRQSVELHQQEVVAAITRVVKAWIAADDEDVLMLARLL